MKGHLSENPIYQLWVLLHQTRDVFHKVREKEVARYGITATQCAVLFIISSLGNKATPTMISRWLLREPHSISSILARMEKQGFIRKERNPENPAESLIILTDKGQQAYEKTSDITLINEIFGCLSEEEKRGLVSSLMKLRNNALRNLFEMNYTPYP